VGGARLRTRDPEGVRPGLLLPGITFAFLYAWSLLERKVTGDDAEHLVLDRPRDRLVRAALGVATLSFYVVLLVSASNDLIAKWLRLSVEGVTWSKRALLLTVPPAAGYVTLRTGAALSGTEGRLTHPPRRAFRARSKDPPVSRVDGS
jgi:hypothetical protein